MKKTKNLFLVFLSILLVATLSMFAFACSCNEDDLAPTNLTIDSSTEVTIEIGQEYTLIYTCKGTVTVTVDGGVYDEDTRKFSAEEEGVYTLTVTGTEEGKAPTTKEVKITVVASADKTVLKTALSKINGLIGTDYTAESWAKLNSAKAQGNTVLNAHGKTQDEINAAATDIENAITALVPVALKQATVTDTAISFDDTTYYAEDYKNFEAIAAEVTELNNNAEVKLNSDYASKLAAIVAKLVANPILKVSGAPSGIMLVNELVKYEMTATVDDGAKVVWTVNGGTPVEGTTCEYKPENFGEEFEIKVTSTIGEGDNATVKEETFTGKFARTAYTVGGAHTDKVTVENNVITVGESCEWGEDMGKKVVLSDLTFSGDVTVYFDVMFTELGSPSVLGIFFLNDKGEQIGNWAVVNGNDGFIEVATRDDNAVKVRVPAPTTSLNTVYHLKATRYIKDGSGYLSIWLLDDNGRVITENLGNDIAKDYVGAVKLGVQAEHCKGTVSNIRVENGTEIIDKSALGAAIRECVLEFPESDYVSTTLTAYKAALSLANLTYNSNTATQEDIVAKANLLKEKFEALAFNPVVAITIGEGEFTFGDKTYVATNYENFDDVVAQIQALTGYEQQSVYDAKVAELVATLVESASIEVVSSLQGKYLVAEIPTTPITFTATVGEGATVTWKVGGVEVAADDNRLSENGTVLTIVPADGGYKVEAVASFGDATSSPVVLEGGYYKTNYAVHKDFTDKIEVVDGIIVAKEDLPWADGKGDRGRKVMLDNINLMGEFSLTFDLKFTENNKDFTVMGLFILDATSTEPRGEGEDNFIVLNNINNDRGHGHNENTKGFISVKADGGEDCYAIPKGITEFGNTFTVRVSRYMKDGKWFLKGEILDNDGNVVAVGAQGDVCEKGKALSDNRVRLGIQAEKGSFELSNFVVVSGEVYKTDAVNGIINKPVSENLFVDYEREGADALIDARNSLIRINKNHYATASLLNEAVESYNKALDALVVKTIAKAVVLENEFSYDGVDYISELYSNFAAVAAKITELNANEEITLCSAYDKAIKEIIAELAVNFEVKLEGLVGGNLAVSTLGTYNLTATVPATADDATAPEYTYEWSVNGEVVTDATAATYTFAPETFGEYTVSVKVSNGTSYQIEEVTANFVESRMTVHKDLTSKVKVENNVLKVTESVEWSNWENHEGRKVVFEDLIFNGSFSFMMDVDVKKMNGDVNVFTIHVFNADTITGGATGYGAFLLNPKKLEVHAGGDKPQEENAVLKSIMESDNKKMTVKVTVLKSLLNNQVTFIVGILNPATGEWSYHSQTRTTGYGLEHGLAVGVNVEHLEAEFSNFRYELLDVPTYMKGMLSSKRPLSKAIEQYTVDLNNYVDGENKTAYVKAMADAQKYLKDENSVEADYVGAVEPLKAAYDALQADIKIATVTGYFAHDWLTEARDITASFGDKEESVSAVKWTYTFTPKAGEAENKQVEGKVLTIGTATGVYSNVKLVFHYNDKDWEYDYPDISVGVTLSTNRPNDIKIGMDENGATAKVLNGCGWAVEAISICNGAKFKNFELSFDIKHNRGENVFAFDLFDKKAQPVYRVEGNEIGFDQFKDNKLDDDPSKPTAKYQGLSKQVAGSDKITCILKLENTAEGVYNITFTVKDKEGTVIGTRVWTNFNGDVNGTAIPMAVEHRIGTFSNFVLTTDITPDAE